MEVLGVVVEALELAEAMAVLEVLEAVLAEQVCRDNHHCWSMFWSNLSCTVHRCHRSGSCRMNWHRPMHSNNTEVQPKLMKLQQQPKELC